MGAWNFYTAKEIKPRGWLKRQLEIQAAGLSGNLDKVWRDVRDSAWIGGDAEGWERVPYWLDGFIPLAYLLENEDMIARAKRYIDAILAAQKSDGWICPCSDADRKTYDTWAVLLIAKVLTVYYECSKDERIPKALYDKKMYEYEKNGVERKYPYCDYEYWPKSDWNYAYCAGALTLHRRETDAVPFSSGHPPVTITARAVQIDWGMEPGYDALCAKTPRSRTPLGDAEEIELYPYGCAKLRMTELPLIDS